MSIQSEQAVNFFNKVHLCKISEKYLEQHNEHINNITYKMHNAANTIVLFKDESAMVVTTKTTGESSYRKAKDFELELIYNKFCKLYVIT